jgi:tRNA 5-methylaminomethyl-2-thiouridine biosynthesis bifunctional protein
MPRLPPLPDLQWTPEGVPRAAAFDDVYRSREGGLAESEAVFLAGCGLPDAWRGRRRFSICELGFGVGVNVLAVWRAWRASRLPHAILHISSIEAYPVAGPDAARALAGFPEVADLAGKLLARWPVRAYAPQRIWFPEDGFALTLHVGEAEALLPGFVSPFDAWFLDGFAPARNPGMWSPKVFSEIARLSAPDARAATYTVAGEVRRGLEAVGFRVEKKRGFGSKRERLEARAANAPQNRHYESASLFSYGACQPQRVAILGAGVAGASCARALVGRNVETIVLEAERSPAAGGSGNPAGLVMPRLDRDGGALSELFLAAYLEAVHTYQSLGLDVYVQCGVEERALDRRREALADLLSDPPLPEDWFAALPNGAALHKRAGLVRPAAAVSAMLQGATLMCETPIAALEGAVNGWLLRAGDGRAVLKADAVVLACGAALRRFESAQFLPIQLSRGQLEWGEAARLEHAVTRGGYAAPFEGGVLFGATFDSVETDAPPAPDEHSRERNLAMLANLVPDCRAMVDQATLRSRAALRAAMPDRAPIAGLAPDAPAWLDRYQGLAHGRRVTGEPPARAGLYLFGGLGARGLVLAPLLGERLAAEMFAEPQVLSRAALDAVHPARFLHRRLRKGD